MSYKISLHPKRKAASRLVTATGAALQKALIHRKSQGKFTQADLARLLGADRSSVNRHFSGYSNLTLNTVGELAWALDHEVDITLTPKVSKKGENDHKTAIGASSENRATTKSGHLVPSRIGSASLLLQAQNV